MPVNVSKALAPEQSAVWARWLLFAGAVLVAKSVIKTGAAVVATHGNLSETQRGALRELFRM
jgi:phosphate/sulfate permease